MFACALRRVQSSYRSIGFSGTCLGQIDGLQESVDLGDGNGTSECSHYSLECILN